MHSSPFLLRVSAYFYYLAESKELTVYTHLYINRNDARKLFDAFAPKPLKDGQFGAVTLPSFDAHFSEFRGTYLSKLGAMLEHERAEEMFVLKFDHYLARVPAELDKLEVIVVKAEIRRYNSAPTKARAGYYEDRQTGFYATVERVFPTQRDQHTKPAPLYAQNIIVSGHSLADVQKFNTNLSCGFYARFLVNAFE